MQPFHDILAGKLSSFQPLVSDKLRDYNRLLAVNTKLVYMSTSLRKFGN